MSLIIDNLSKEYSNGLFGTNYKALNEISITIPRNSIYAIVGQNGAGKTTLIKSVMKFIKKSSGTISFNDLSITDLIKQNQVGYLPEHLVLPKLIRVREYIEDIACLRGLEPKKINASLTEFYTMFDLSNHLSKPIGKLSKGMKRKVAFIQSVMHSPSLLILDEPTDGLDPISRRKLLTYIKKLSKEGTTILITSHLLADLERVCDKVGLINTGYLSSEVELNNIKANHFSLEDWYYKNYRLQNENN